VCVSERVCVCESVCVCLCCGCGGKLVGACFFLFVCERERVCVCARNKVCVCAMGVVTGSFASLYVCEREIFVRVRERV